MLNRITLTLLVALTLAIWPEVSSAAAQSLRVSDERFARLRRGINLSHWFAQSIGKDYSKAHLEMHTTAQDMALVKAMGFDHVRLTCNEFGAFRKAATPSERAAWIRDVRTALEKYDIGWTMWDYAGGFAVVNKTNGHAVADAEIVRALGLRAEGR
jgi:hypothetical protein